MLLLNMKKVQVEALKIFPHLPQHTLLQTNSAEEKKQNKKIHYSETCHIHTHT